VEDIDHPLTSGLPAGAVNVTSTTGSFCFGIPGGSPIIIARLNDGTNRPCVYAFDTGGPMHAGTAPARRVNLFLQNDTHPTLNPSGLSLFDSAVNWALGLMTSPEYELTISATNGSVSLSPPGGLYLEGETIALVATADPGYRFKEWSGDVTGTQASTSIIMNSAKSVTAHFIRVHELTFQASHGNVILNPMQATYDEGSTVTVTAVPSQGYRFKEWSGALNGAGITTIVTVTENMNLLPIFELIIPTLKCERNGTSIVLKWPVDSSPGWKLEWATNLSSMTPWEPIEPPYQHDSIETYWQGNATGSNQFFRLRHP
jgi:hypothetical protein